jgi:hypothetical protein
MSLQTSDESEQNIDWNDETSLRAEGKVRLLPFVRRLRWRGTTARYSNQHGRLSVGRRKALPTHATSSAMLLGFCGHFSAHAKVVSTPRRVFALVLSGRRTL